MVFGYTAVFILAMMMNNTGIVNVTAQNIKKDQWTLIGTNWDIIFSDFSSDIHKTKKQSVLMRVKYLDLNNRIRDEQKHTKVSLNNDH